MPTRDRPRDTPDSYVVRIYRRDPRQPRRLAGTVEIVETGAELGFRNPTELITVLAGADMQQPGPRKGAP